MHKATYVVAALTLWVMQPLVAQISMPHIQMRVLKDFAANGALTGEQEINIVVGNTLHGNGYFKAPNINLFVRTFAFTGTIECDGTCTIITAEPFDEAMFTRVGNGTFVITVDPTFAFEDTENIQKFSNSQKQHVAEPEQEITKEIELDAATFTITGALNIRLAEAVQRNDIQEVHELLRMHTCDQKILDVCMLLAGLSGHMYLAEELITLGAHVDATDSGNSRGQSHLLTAVIGQKADFVDLLIKLGANPNAKNAQWISALSIAVIQEDVASVMALLQSPKIDINTRDRDGNTALLYAVDRRNSALIKLLLQRGADPNLKNYELMSPLKLAVVQKDEASVQALLQAAVIDLNVGDKEWRTPLMHAVYQENVALIQLLLQAGADTRMRDRNGATILDFAKGLDNVEICELIQPKVSTPQLSRAEYNQPKYEEQPKISTPEYGACTYKPVAVEEQLMRTAIYTGVIALATIAAIKVMPQIFKTIAELV